MKDFIKEKYGDEPSILYFHSPVVVDNRKRSSKISRVDSALRSFREMSNPLTGVLDVIFVRP